MRAKANPHEIKNFFNSIKSKADLTWHELAQICHVSSKTITEWANGKYTIPQTTLDSLSKKYRVSPPQVQILGEYWYTSLGGKISGSATFKKYGNIGTAEGRRLGALRALETHQIKNIGYFFPRTIHFPEPSPSLAEFFGILLGDGGISHNQVTITLHKKDDLPYITYVANLCKSLFDIQPSVRERADENICNIVISRIKLVEYLQKMGLKIGNKVHNQINVPDWILARKDYINACIRGLFDTDGSFYIDRHTYKDKLYSNCAMNFTNRSFPLLAFFKNALENISVRPTQKTPFAVFLRKEYDIITYFNKVGSSNPKHMNKFILYFKNKYGGVPKWS